MSTTQGARAVAIVAIVLGGALAVGSAGGAAASTLASAAQQTTSRAIPVAGVDDIDVDMGAGSMRVEFAAIDEAELTVTGGVSADRWTLRQDGSALRVASPDAHFWSWFGWFGAHNGQAVLRLPQSLAGVDADLDLAAGALTADGEFGDLTVSAGAGRLQVKGSADAVSAEIDAGSADLQLADVGSADLQLNAGRMDARFTGAQPQRMTLSASAGSMDVVVPEGQYDVTQETDAGSFENRIGSVPGAASTVRVQVSAGSVILSSGR
ncbi:DUF4097 family beta strand repeat-containing protein [Microbacterium horticulturae]|uniref:DUF4097 family beta strand repeat-containing protein n=1 Tax=Microbacterium horticulturae TaxID=3028316 RepID=A0ABY8BVR9_9MICO|nr:DUF4097 family beta strand repeat-containing protein [Microbacterium sp. KACC 23027]WEG08269.1 DUF4097 family beta strand repeat-containing protein [Microbacterium sp. KACC 23027]